MTDCKNTMSADVDTYTQKEYESMDTESKNKTTEEVKKLIDSFIYDISKLVSKDYNIRLVISPRLKADEHCGHGVFRIENSNLEYTYLGNINEAVKNIDAL